MRRSRAQHATPSTMTGERKEVAAMKRHPLTVLTLFGLIFYSPNVTPAQQKVKGGAKVLMLSGGQRDHHGYRRQAFLLQKALEDTKQLEVTICEDAAILETPGLAKYD